METSMTQGLQERARDLLESTIHRSDVNVSDMERWLSLLAGGAIMAYGLSRRSLAGLGLAAVGGSLVYRGTTGHCSLYQALGHSTAEPHGSQASIPAGAGMKVEESVTIDRPADELYRTWRNLKNLPRILRHIQSVQSVGNNRWRWVARGPLGIPFEWEAEIITEATNELIAWRSLRGSLVDTAGSIHFQPASNGRGTEVRVSLKYHAPAGKLGTAVAHLLGQSPEHQLRDDLQRFKQHVEGERIGSTEGHAASH